MLAVDVTAQDGVAAAVAPAVHGFETDDVTLTAAALCQALTAVSSSAISAFSVAITQTEVIFFATVDILTRHRSGDADIDCRLT